MMLKRLKIYASFVRFSHSVFALPFALTGSLLATTNSKLSLVVIGWVLVAMVSARTAAMGFNRLVDADIDALNPRTRARELPLGVISRTEALTLVVVSAVTFVAVCAQLSLICLALSPVALAIVFWYSLAKRYTTYSQFFLGLAMAVAPLGGWLAVGGRAGWEPWILGLAVGTWVGAFDILYACQDVNFDRRHGLRSIPVRFGIPNSLLMSRGLHIVTVVALAALAVVSPLGPLYLGGVCGVAVLLAYEQSLVSARDLSRVKRAFDLNGYVGIFYLTMTALALYVHE